MSLPETGFGIVLPRRNFLGQCLALGVAPAIVRAEWLMPVRASAPSYLVDPAVWYLPDAPGVDPSWVWVPGGGRFDTIGQAQRWMSVHPEVDARRVRSFWLFRRLPYA